MGGFGGYYKGEKKKLSKVELAKRGKKITKVWELPRVEITGRKKKS